MTATKIPNPPSDETRSRPGTSRAPQFNDFEGNVEAWRSAWAAHLARDSWTLDFDYATNPLPMNGSHGHHHTEAMKVRQVRRTARAEAQIAGLPELDHVRVQLTWCVLTDTRRDVVNLGRTLKAIQDGLVDAGIVPDDTPTRMDTLQNRIIRVGRHHTTGWMELKVTRWDGS